MLVPGIYVRSPLFYLSCSSKSSYLESSWTGSTSSLTYDMLRQKTSNAIKIKNISNVEKYVHGLKPFNDSEELKDIEKVSETFPGQINTVKHLLLKNHTKNYRLKKGWFVFSPSSSSETLTDESENQMNIAHKKISEIRLSSSPKKIALYFDVVKDNSERGNDVKIIDKTTFSNKSDQFYQYFHLQLIY